MIHILRMALFTLISRKLMFLRQAPPDSSGDLTLVLREGGRFIFKATAIPLALTLALTPLELRNFRRQAVVFAAAGAAVGAGNGLLSMSQLASFMGNGFKSHAMKVLPTALKNQLSEHDYKILMSVLLGALSTGMTLPFQTQRVLINTHRTLRPGISLRDVLRLSYSGLGVRLLEGQIFSATTLLLSGWLGSKIRQLTSDEAHPAIENLLGMSIAGSIAGFLTTPLNTIAKALIAATEICSGESGKLTFHGPNVRQVVERILKARGMSGLFLGAGGNAIRAAAVFLLAEAVSIAVEQVFKVSTTPAPAEKFARIAKISPLVEVVEAPITPAAVFLSNQQHFLGMRIKIADSLPANESLRGQPVRSLEFFELHSVVEAPKKGIAAVLKVENTRFVFRANPLLASVGVVRESFEDLQSVILKLVDELVDQISNESREESVEEDDQDLLAEGLRSPTTPGPLATERERTSVSGQTREQLDASILGESPGAASSSPLSTGESPHREPVQEFSAQVNSPVKKPLAVSPPASPERRRAPSRTNAASMGVRDSVFRPPSTTQAVVSEVQAQGAPQP